METQNTSSDDWKTGMITVGAFNIHLLANDRTIRQQISKDIDLNNTVNRLTCIKTH